MAQQIRYSPAPQTPYTLGGSARGEEDPLHTQYGEHHAYPMEKPRRKGLPRWAKFAIPIALLIIVAAVVGGVVGGIVGNKNKNSDSNGSGNGNGNSGSGGSPTAGTSPGAGAIRSVTNSYSNSLIAAASKAALAGGGNDL
ncbi:hypothetical protein OC861_006859, partial [Tilletia horrida]